MSCIGTAGHVDHGKSTLVTALTGMDPDRLAEEKARGMTIDLGFAWVTLPSGREASIVDVPGHEAFIRNMLAGVGGIDAALLVVAADEGVMPQTTEHLAILDLLHVSAGVVALTKSDLVDDDWLALVREEVAECLAPTTLAGAPILPCSAVTRAGLPDLLAALDAALDAAPGRRDIGRPRLPIDRAFSITGFGTVVTGTLQDGVLRAGQEVEVQPRGLRARVRGVQAHKQAIEAGHPGGRLAVNLAGVAKADLARGDVLALPGAVRAVNVFDARVEVLASAPRPLVHNAEVDVFVGAAEVHAHALLLDADEVPPGESGWAQLRLARPLALARGDRFIVRIPSPSETIGGGTALDLGTRRHRRHDADVLTRLALLARGDPEQLLAAALGGEGSASQAGKPAKRGGPATSGGHDGADLVRSLGLPSEEVQPALDALVARGAVVRVGAWHYAAATWERLLADSRRMLAGYHRHNPLRFGMPREEWRSRLGFAPRELADIWPALVASGAADDAITGVAEAETSAGVGAAGAGRGALVRLPGHVPAPTPEQERTIRALLARFAAAPFAPPDRAEVEASVGAEVAAYLVDSGTLLRLNDAVLLGREAYAEAIRRIAGHLATHETLTVADARDLLGTTRKYMLALFEHLDERRVTLRRGDDRVLGPAAEGLLARLSSPAARDGRQ